MAKSVAEKMLIKPGQRLRIVGAPTSLQSQFAGVASARTAVAADVLLVFAIDRASLDRSLTPLLSTARTKRLWIAYPKAGQLGTDLNRDLLHGEFESLGFKAFRQIALDEVWSALAFSGGESA
jgi:hypothetical protein